MPWFWDLVSLSVQIPFTLPLVRDLVRSKKKFPISAIASEAIDTETVSNEKLHSSPPQQSSSDTSSFKQDLGNLKDEWAAKFACIEALLTRNASTSLQPGAHARASPTPSWGVI